MFRLHHKSRHAKSGDRVDFKLSRFKALQVHLTFLFRSMIHWVLTLFLALNELFVHCSDQICCVFAQNGNDLYKGMLWAYELIEQ